MSYVCKKCSKKFDYKSQLERHENMKKDCTYIIPDIYKCKKCDYETKNRSNYMRHIKSNNGCQNFKTKNENATLNNIKTTIINSFNDDALKIVDDKVSSIINIHTEAVKKDVLATTYNTFSNSINKREINNIGNFYIIQLREFIDKNYPIL